jgi:phosphatidylglycerol---prolipoprotein diacylglyceryl transferase
MRHSLDPLAFELGGLVLSWYWLAYFVGFWIILGIGLKSLRDYQTLTPVDFITYLQWGLPLMLISSRLFYVVFYYPSFFLEHPALIPQFWRGGLSFHGAIIGPLFLALSLAKKKSVSLYRFTDLVALGLPFALFFGRLGNFMNGELYGRETTLPWGMIFPLAELVDGRELIRHPSQLYQALSEGLLLGLILWFRRREIQTAGLVSTSFLIGYGALRFFVEFTREPDPQLGFILGLSMGQHLCLFMIGLGLFLRLRVGKESAKIPEGLPPKGP